MKININLSLKFISLLIILFLCFGMVSASDDIKMDLNDNDLSNSIDNLNSIDNSNLDDSNGPSLDYAGSIDDSINEADSLLDESDIDLENDGNLESNNEKNNQLSSSNLESSVVSAPKNITIEHTGDDLADIQRAINSALWGDIVVLGNYTYDIGSGQINVTKNITLKGDGINTLINGNGGGKTGCILKVSTNGMTVDGITFNNTGADLTYTDYDTLEGWAIRLDVSSNILVNNCSFLNFNREINFDGTSRSTVINCYFTGATTRITNGDGKERGTRAISFSSDSNYNKIINNTFYGSMLDGINIDAASNTKIIGNTFFNNSYSIFLDSAATENLIIANNSFIDCGHYKTVFDGSIINFENLPIIYGAKSFDNFNITGNTFYVSENNILIFCKIATDIGFVNISNNTVNLLNDSYDPSTITFIKFPASMSMLSTIGEIDIVNNTLPSNMVYGKFPNMIHYIEDGDIIIYGPRNESVLNIIGNDSFYSKAVIIDLTLYSDEKPLNGTVVLEINEKSYNVTIKEGIGQIKVNDSFEITTYTVKANFLGDSYYLPSNASKTIAILVRPILTVSHSGDDTKDLQELIDSAFPEDIIDLGDYNYTLDTINIDKDLTFISTGNASISLNDSSTAAFSLNCPVSFSISNITFKVNKNNETLVFNKVENEVSSFDLTNITVLSENEDLLNNSISLIRIESNSSDLSFDEIHLKDNKLLGNMKSILLFNNPIQMKSTKIIYTDMNTTAVDTDSEGRIGKNFTVTLKDGDNNPLENKEVKIGFNGKIYIKTTDANGVAKLQINLKRADIYTFAISFLGDDEYNGSFAVAKITVKKQKPSLTVATKTYKASAKTKTLTAVFKSASGKLVKGKKITFVVNGKTYTGTTDAKGCATVKVSLNKKGTYTFTTKYAGDNTYSAIQKSGKLIIK